MSFAETVKRNRSYRRFDEGFRVKEETLRELVGLARLAPSAMNRQPLKYVISASAKLNTRIFPTLAWAGDLPDWPAAGQRPAAYIVILLDTALSPSADLDAGISAQTILLGAVEKGLGGCVVGNVRREDLGRELSLPGHLKILLVLALGKPAEAVLLEDLSPGGSASYYRDARRVQHVPKRALEDLIHASYG